MKDRIDGAFFLPGVGFFLACVGWGAGEDEKKPAKKTRTKMMGRK